MLNGGVVLSSDFSRLYNYFNVTIHFRCSFLQPMEWDKRGTWMTLFEKKHKMEVKSDSLAPNVRKFSGATIQSILFWKQGIFFSLSQSWPFFNENEFFRRTDRLDWWGFTLIALPLFAVLSFRQNVSVSVNRWLCWNERTIFSTKKQLVSWILLKWSHWRKICSSAPVPCVNL